MKRSITTTICFAFLTTLASGCNQGGETPAKQSTGTGDRKPAAAAPAESEDSYFHTPGGKYTDEDIKANGDKPPTEKYKNIGHANGGKAVAGDKLCPISKGKANPEVTWVIGGKSYAFCCPPCIEDFVKKAKEHPADVKDPSEYVKK